MHLFKNTKLILVLILLLAAFLRLPFLGQLPSGITIDEAGQGYSAYSILKTGRDEWGDFLPLNPRGFGDYKPPVYMYLLVPSIALFGLSEFAVRFPAAIAGILLVWVVYFLVKELFGKKSLALIAGFLTAITPILVYDSRLGWESNYGLLFLTLGIWLFVKSLKKNYWLIISIISFGLSALSYHSFKLLAPIIFLGLIIIYWKTIQRINKKDLLFSVITALIFVLIISYGFLFSGASRRAADQSLAKEENLKELRQSQIEDGLPHPFNRIINNKPQYLVSRIADNYIGYYSLDAIFGPHRSDSSVLNFPGKGLLYIWQLPLLLLGLFYIIKNLSKSSWVLFLWLFTAPIPAAITQDYMHAGRAQSIFPVLVIISSVGFYWLMNWIKPKYKIVSIGVISLIILVSLIYRIDNYMFHTFNKPHGGLVQGYKEIAQYTKENQGKYDKIIFTKMNSEPQAFIAFYTQMDPVYYQSESQKWKDFEEKGFKFLDMTDYNLGKYNFRGVDFNKDKKEKNTLIVSTDSETPDEQAFKFTVKNNMGNLMFGVVDTNEISE